VNGRIHFSKDLHILFSVVINEWHPPVGMHWTANRSMSNCMMTWTLSVTSVRIQTLIEFDCIDPDAEICEPDLSGCGSGSAYYNDEDNDNEDWAL
jgi:hypothetical protein